MINQPLLARAVEGTDWPSATIAIAGIAFVTIVAAVALWQVFSTARAQMSIAREKAYRELAEKTFADQAETSSNLRALSDEVAKMAKSVSEMEQMLKDVR